MRKFAKIIKNVFESEISKKLENESKIKEQKVAKKLAAVTGGAKT